MSLCFQIKKQKLRKTNFFRICVVLKSKNKEKILDEIGFIIFKKNLVFRQNIDYKIFYRLNQAKYQKWVLMGCKGKGYLIRMLILYNIFLVKSS